MHRRENNATNPNETINHFNEIKQSGFYSIYSDLKYVEIAVENRMPWPFRIHFKFKNELKEKLPRRTRMHIANIEFDSRVFSAAKSQQRQHPMRYFIHRIKPLSQFRFSVRFPFKSFSIRNKLLFHSDKMANWKRKKNTKKGK